MCYKGRFRTLTLCTILCMSIQISAAQSQFVYQIQAFSKDGSSRSSTGFRLQGIKGIITTLHGVAGSNNITAKGPSASKALIGLRIVKADVRRDLALLSSVELKAMPSAGLIVAESVSWNDLSKSMVTVRGYPAGLFRTDLLSQLWIRKPPIAPLRNLIGGDTERKLARRNSPSPDIRVLSIEGNLLPGHSGAPIFDRTGKVIAVGDGGLKEGTVGIAWAIPLAEVEWAIPDPRLLRRLDDQVSKDPLFQLQSQFTAQHIVMKNFRVNSFKQTGILLRKGDIVSVRAGKQIYMGPHVKDIGPDGKWTLSLGGMLEIKIDESFLLDTRYALGSLLFRVGSDDAWKFCGSVSNFVAQSDGMLEFEVNDARQEDNHKSDYFDVQVRIASQK